MSSLASPAYKAHATPASAAMYEIRLILLHDAQRHAKVDAQRDRSLAKPDTRRRARAASRQVVGCAAA